MHKTIKSDTNIYNQLQKKTLAAEQMLGRNLPFSLEAERAVLGSLLLHDGQLDAIVQILTPQDFYSTAHKAIFEAMVRIAERKQRLDLIVLQDELAKVDKLTSVGGIIYLVSLQEDIPAIGLVEQHAGIIKEKAILRELIASAIQIVSNCYAQDNKEIETVLDEAERTIFQIAQRRAHNTFVQLNIWVKKTFEYLSSMKSHRTGITGIETGYKKLDDMTSGLQNGDLIVLAARPSMGKTALALNLVRNSALNGVGVGFFSLEMSAEQLTLRLLASESRVPLQKIRSSSVDSNQWIRLTQVAGQLGEMKIFIDDTPMQSIMDIRAKARKLKAEHNIQLLVIDYLQLLHSNKRHENRHQEVSEISRSLKALAKELNIPILALSQLSRAVDSRTDKRPMLSDLRESGAIEQDADLIAFLYRDIVYNSETEHPSLAELIIGKQRNGPTGTVHLNFLNELTLFEDSDYHE